MVISWKYGTQYVSSNLRHALLRITQENSVLQEKWVQQYGTTISYKGLFGVRGSLLTFLTETEPKPPAASALHDGYNGFASHP